ncbi:MAG TPA: FkbM family methyltransferase [Bacteroidales bacterium]|nr:FkbM family methyltransferase [Bacteroidales bacterium]HRZ49581.1 FkbM family methyltransferase [Bacteroidales bacterium]
MPTKKSPRSLLRKTLNLLHLDVTRNLAYDRLTRSIMRKVIGRDTNCIDIGCHKGEMLDLILALAPDGTHYAFEPIPDMYDELLARYNGRTRVLPFALADFNGESEFQYIRNDPAYSGLKKRSYDIKDPDIEVIRVEVKRLDDIIEANHRVGFIKIDVEGGEFGVLKGSRELIIRDKPVIIFECGLGASDFYDTDPGALFRFFSEETGHQVSFLKSYVKGNGSLTEEAFVSVFRSNAEWYFVAHPA